MRQILLFLLRMLPAMAAALPAAVIFRLWGTRRLAKAGLATTPWHEAGLLAFLLFAAGLAAITVLPQGWRWTAPTWERVNLLPFRVFRDSLWEYRAGNHLYFLINILGNIVMFLPFGFFPPLLWRRMDGLLQGTGTALGVSLCVELCQLFQNRGTDVDDLWLNALGGALGYGLYRLFCRLWPGFTEKFRIPAKKG